ncbi:TadE/TadG family type IV pilus assembly protein [Sphingomonas sp. CJ20]
MTFPSPLRRLLAERRGTSAIEFALIVPVLVMMLLGMMDLSYQSYVQAVLEGAMQKAGRDSGIEAANTTTIDNSVKAKVAGVAPRATFAITRKSYSTYANMAPERFTDTNGNGVRDTGECYDDINGNRVWDADPGLMGQGGANDVTEYTVTATYNRIFPLATMLGWSRQQSVSATTLLKNQPYQSQAVPTVVSRCN